jgi:hypothetical protein
MASSDAAWFNRPKMVQVPPPLGRSDWKAGQGTISEILQMKFAEPRPYANPEAAARKIVEIANSVESVQDGRIYIELINDPMLFEHKATPAEYGAGLKLAIERGWLTLEASAPSPQRGRGR